PDAAARMSPEDPGDGLQLRMARCGGEVAERLQESLIRALPRVEPEFRAAGREIDLLVEPMIGRTEQGAVPLPGERLPVQVVGGGRALPGGRRPGAVLVHNDAAQAGHAVGGPERVGDADLQSVRAGRGWVLDPD